MAGVVCLGVSVALLIVVHHRAYYDHKPSPLLLGMLMLVIVIFGVVLARTRQTLEWLKSKITYPRTGYAAPPYFTENTNPAADLVMLNLSGAREKETITPMLVAEDLRWRLWAMLIILLSEPLAGKFIKIHPLCGLIGCAAGVIPWMLSRRDARKCWAVIMGMIFALLFTMEFIDNFQNLETIEGALYYSAGVGLAIAGAGAITLALYMKRNPVARA